MPAAVSVFTLVVAAVVWIRVSGDDGPAVGPGAEDTRPDGLDDSGQPELEEVAVTDRIPLDGRPVGVVATADALWVTNGDLVRVDPQSLTVTDSIEMLLATYHVAASDEQIWVVNGPPYEEITVVDQSTLAATDAESRPIPEDVAIGEGGTWSTGLSETVRYDEDTLQITASVPVAGQAIAVAGDDVWVAGGSELIRIDALTNEITDAIALGTDGTGFGSAVSAVAVSRDTIWVASDDAGRAVVVRVDPEAMRVTDTIDVGRAREDGYPTGLTIDGDDVWVTTSADGTLTRIRQSDGRVLQTLDVGGTPRGVAVSNGAVWVADDDTDGEPALLRVT